MLVYFFLLLAANVGENIEKSEVGQRIFMGQGGCISTCLLAGRLGDSGDAPLKNWMALSYLTRELLLIVFKQSFIFSFPKVFIIKVILCISI